MYMGVINMDFITNFLSYLGLFTIGIIILSICLLWLFIRSAVASGTKKGILDAYNIINQNNPDFEKANTNLFDDSEKSYIYILLSILIVGIMFVYSFFIKS